MQRILFATDFSERSDRALRRAVLLARDSKATIDIVHVIDNDRPRRIVDHEAADARDLLAELCASLSDVEAVAATASVLTADPFEGILAAIADNRPDMLVIGPHRRQILRDAFVGTTAERTIRRATCPVLMVNGPPVGPYRHIVVTTDLGASGGQAIRGFLSLGIGTDAQLSALHVFDAPALRLAVSDTLPTDSRQSYLDDAADEARRALARLLAQEDAPRMRPVVSNNSSTTAGEIHKVADRLDADLLVVSAQGKGALARAVLGSVTEQVLASASRDVLVLPVDARAAPAP